MPKIEWVVFIPALCSSNYGSLMLAFRDIGEVLLLTRKTLNPLLVVKQQRYRWLRLLVWD